jgi:O-antigen ligase
MFNHITYKEYFHFSVNFYSIFLIITFIPDFLGINPSLITLPFWGLKLILAIWIMVKDSRSYENLNINEILFLALIIIYIVNLYIDIFLKSSPQYNFLPSFSEELINFISFAINIVLAISFRYHPTFHGEKSFRFFLVTLTFGLVLAFLFAIRQDEIFVRYDANSTINSIIYGQASCALSLISMWAFPRVKNWRYRLVLIVLFLFGLISIAKTGSRSPVVVLVLVSAFYFIAQFGKIRGIILFSTFVLVIFLFIKPITSFLESMNSSFLTRLTAMIVEQDSSGRDRIYLNVLEQIKQNPIFGSYYLVTAGQGRGGYPHNFILEAFMTTGFLGGIPFLILLIAALIKSYSLIKINHSSGWIILLFLQIVVYGMFSTSLYSSQDFWILLFFVSSIKLQRVKLLKQLAPIFYLSNKKIINQNN